MNAAVIDWQSALGVLVAGLVLGGFLFWRLRRAPVAVSPPVLARSLDRRDLEARRDTLLRQLRELDDTASKRTPEQLARERLDLELQAAAVLRDLDRLAPPVDAAGASAGAAPSPAVGPDHATMRGFLWGTLTAGAIAALVFFVNKAASPRPEGGSVTGTAGPLSAAPGGAMAGSEDLEARVEQARAALGRQDMMGVWNETQFVLQRQPGHPRALAYQALVRLAMGQADVAETMLKQALSTAPDLLEAYLHLAVVYARTGRMPQAESTLRTAMSRFPDDHAGLEQLLKELKSLGPEDQVAVQPDAHAGIAPPGEGDPHADVAPPMETAEGRPAAAPDMGRGGDAAAGQPVRLSGIVELDRSAQARAPGGGLVFVTVRAAGVTSGPPVAVKRFSAAALPGAFAITTADSMMGQELPESVYIEARLDPDGDPMSRSPSDPIARLDGVKLGSTGLRLVLK